ncbi:hypothetical protein QY91_01890 [Enterobacter ludwigii]|nr:hypothetical protein BH714_01900 [Enterobacter ludwigii]KIF84631.1 hypothetical protein QY91_01890 [Enterobacter ludwigii]
MAVLILTVLLRSNNGDPMRTFTGFFLFCVQIVFWFFVCGLVWAAFFPLDNVQRLANVFSIYGIEGVHDFASILVLSVSSIGATGITVICMRLLFSKT